jgi:hypothetical protein
MLKQRDQTFTADSTLISRKKRSRAFYDRPEFTAVAQRLGHQSVVLFPNALIELKQSATSSNDAPPPCARLFAIRMESNSGFMYGVSAVVRPKYGAK